MSAETIDGSTAVPNVHHARVFLVQSLMAEMYCRLIADLGKHLQGIQTDLWLTTRMHVGLLLSRLLASRRLRRSVPLYFGAAVPHHRTNLNLITEFLIRHVHLLSRHLLHIQLARSQSAYVRVCKLFEHGVQCRRSTPHGRMSRLTTDITINLTGLQAFPSWHVCARVWISFRLGLHF